MTYIIKELINIMELNLGNLVVAELVSKFPTFYKTQRFITLSRESAAGVSCEPDD
jgi:hypothetical protein